MYATFGRINVHSIKKTPMDNLLRQERKAVSLYIMLCHSIKEAWTQGNLIYLP